MKDRPYKRLPGRRFLSMAGKQTLWLGRDHLLSVCSSGFAEQYRRFFLRDIAAITVQRTRRWMIGNIVLGTILGIFGLIAVAVLGSGAGAETGFATFLLVMVVGPSLVGLVVNLLRGPTCSVRIQTAVQTREIPAVGRLKAADKLLAELTPLIQAAQLVSPPPPPPPPPSSPVPEPSAAPEDPVL
jgi:hypothetical protein